MAIFNATFVLAETNVQLPMQTILDSPMTSQRLSIASCRHPPAADEITNLRTCLPVDGTVAATDSHGGQMPPRFPIPDLSDLLDYHAGPLLVPTMALFLAG